MGNDIKKALKATNYVEEKVELELPRTGKLISKFAQEVVSAFKGKGILFYRPNSREVVEICKIKDKDSQEKYNGFNPIKPSRFITLSENIFIPGILKPKTNEAGQFIGNFFKEKSMSGDLCNTVLQSPMLQDSLPNVVRIFNFPMPIIFKDKLTFPKKGFDERFNSFLPYDSPEIDKPNMCLEEAKSIIEGILKEFCFENPIDKTHAIAALISPALKGLYPTFNTRTPIIVYTANRERAGKDYLAGITGIIYEGVALEESPISYGDNKTNNEEIRKKILSAMISGKRRLHFANNKGFLNSAIIEAVSTASVYSDRVLGRNEIISFENELDISLSGNVGITFTPDFLNRSRFINLFLDIEDANKRKFENPNLHEYVLKNRGLILSAIYALIKNWFDNGHKKGSVPFASFPDWAGVCGGLMESVGYDNPCVNGSQELLVGGDVETRDMKRLFEVCYEKHPKEFINIGRIREITKEEDEIFSHIDFDQRKGQVRFGITLKKFVGRILSDIKLQIENKNAKGHRQNYRFTKEVVKLVKLVNLITPLQHKYKNIIYKGSNINNIDNIDKNQEICKPFKVIEDIDMFVDLEAQDVGPFISGNIAILGSEIANILMIDNKIEPYKEVTQ